jgi:transcriptional regulator with XRE-family HTH domain
MAESLHQYVIDRLQLCKGRWSEVAEGTGISKRTIEKIARKEVKDPGVSLVEQLAGYFRRQEAERAPGTKQ